MEFVKMEGLGNDFIVIAGPADPNAGEIRSWCDRRRGIGADGVLEVTRLGGDRVRMRYWNADGGAAEMCGNGLRCVARFAVERGWVEARRFVVETAVGDRLVEIDGEGSVRALLGTPRDEGPVAAAGVALHRVDIGNPHAIWWVDDVGEAPVAEVGPAVERDASFAAGTNVEFAQVVGTNRIGLRVWERGVGETLACGTGAAATAFLAYRQGRVGAKVEMALRGGVLEVELTEEGAWIRGPANTVFRGVLVS
jgi:diaminopimelate epimerase